MKLREAIEFQAPVMRDAALAAHAQLDRLGVRHAFVGGLAVGAYGYVRATGDVDFLVGPDAFEEQPGGLVTFRAGVPIHVRGVSVAYLSAEQFGPVAAAALAAPILSDDLPVVPLPLLVTMKLVAYRMRDRADIVELIKRGADAGAIRAHLASHAADLVARFDEAVAQASREQRAG